MARAEVRTGRTAHREGHKGAPSHHGCRPGEGSSSRPSPSVLPGWWLSLFSFHSAGESRFGGGAMAEQPALMQAPETRPPFPQGQCNLSLVAPSPSAPVQSCLLLHHVSEGVRAQCSLSYKGVEVREKVSRLVLGDTAVLCQRAADGCEPCRPCSPTPQHFPFTIQVTKAQKYLGCTCFRLHLHFEQLLARASITLGTGVHLTASPCRARLCS